jgi:circadian clock protein KaiC
MACIVDELENVGVTTAYSAETPDLFGENLELSLSGMSALTHNLVLLNHRERATHTRRTIAVLKVRDSAHDLSVREFAITTQGIRVASASAEQRQSKVAKSPATPSKAALQKPKPAVSKPSATPKKTAAARSVVKKGKTRKQRA